MERGDAGFLYPVVNSINCIECNRCTNVCPVTNDEVGSAPKSAFAAWSKQECSGSKSTSGAIAHELSKHILNEGGVVYGCAVVNGIAKHIRVEDESGLDSLRGSKYVQSDTCSAFSQVRSDIAVGKSVLFVGTPCQVYALKRFIGKKSERLFLVDILCHGVPSQQMLEEHIRKIAKGRLVINYSFRDGTDYVFRVKGESWEYEARYLHDTYIAGFLNGCTLRESCANCHFAKTERHSDITIGDFWGLGETIPIDFKAANKVSLVLPNTEKGVSLLHGISSDIALYERPLDEAVAGNYPLRDHSGITLNFKVFRLLYQFIPFEGAVIISLSSLYFKKIGRIICRITYGIREE